MAITRDDGDWEGDAPLKWTEGAGPSRRRKIIEVAVAGPLGQLKFRAQSLWGDVLFNRSDHLKRFREIIRNDAADELTGLSVSFITPNGDEHNLNVRNFNDIGDFMRLHELASELDDAKLYEIVDSVRELLDQVKVWKGVSQLAQLLNCNGQVEGREIAALLGQVGLA